MLSDLITDLIRAKTPNEKEAAYRRLEKGGDSYGAIDYSDGSVDCGQIDATCADEIVQYALFGELVFG